ncbi:AzlC family ABC transporter permease [Treponema sp.]|uniref:AzlC family ABC transporter permease n=1 Tax=Treponema sp. TaxID=166 RepID=UPI003F103AC0
MNRFVFAQALKITAPVFFGYIAIGIGFGMLLVNAGYPWWLAVVLSLVMYTGSGQYFIVGQLACGASFAEILLVQFLLSIRHIFYGLSLISKYKNTGAKKPYLIFSLTDETFALVHGIEPPARVDRASFYAAVSMLDQSYWCLGSLIGALACTVMNRYGLERFLAGVDFALTSLFIVLLIEQLRASKDCVPAVTGACAAFISVVLYRAGVFGSSNIIWVSICAALGVMLLARGPSFFERERILKLNESGEDVL